VEPDARMYQMMLEVCARMGDARVTRALLDEMKTRKIEVGEDTRTALMAAFKHSNEIVMVTKDMGGKGIREEEEIVDEEEDYFAIFQQTIRDQMYSKE
jgi:pentatricopeptide repeat protein